MRQHAIAFALSTTLLTALIALTTATPFFPALFFASALSLIGIGLYHAEPLARIRYPAVAVIRHRPAVVLEEPIVHHQRVAPIVHERVTPIVHERVTPIVHGRTTPTVHERVTLTAHERTTPTVHRRVAPSPSTQNHPIRHTRVLTEEPVLFSQHAHNTAGRQRTVRLPSTDFASSTHQPRQTFVKHR